MAFLNTLYRLGLYEEVLYYSGEILRYECYQKGQERSKVGNIAHNNNVEIDIFTYVSIDIPTANWILRGNIDISKGTGRITTCHRFRCNIHQRKD